MIFAIFGFSLTYAAASPFRDALNIIISLLSSYHCATTSFITLHAHEGMLHAISWPRRALLISYIRHAAAFAFCLADITLRYAAASTIFSRARPLLRHAGVTQGHFTRKLLMARRTHFLYIISLSFDRPYAIIDSLSLLFIYIGLHHLRFRPFMRLYRHMPMISPSSPRRRVPFDVVFRHAIASRLISLFTIVADVVKLAAYRPIAAWLFCYAVTAEP